LIEGDRDLASIRESEIGEVDKIGFRILKLWEGE